MIKIYIKEHSGELVLETTDKTYKEDLLKNKDKLDMWFYCIVEYDDGEPERYDYPWNHNYRSPRRIITVNGRNIYAKYNFDVEKEHGNVYDDLLEFLNTDFETVEQAVPTLYDDKSYKTFMKETSAPANKNIKPVENNLEKELIDD